MRGMGVRIWGTGLVAAAVIAAVTASGAPVVQAAEATQGLTWAEVSYTSGLTADDADKAVAATPPGTPDVMVRKWACELPIRIYYTAQSTPDLVRVRRELEYPVRYLRDLGYDVTIVRDVAYQSEYPQTGIGDVLLVAAVDDANAARLQGDDLLALTEPMAIGPTITSAQVTVATEGITSAVLLHEFGHVLGLPHKDGSVMGVTDASALGFDPSETAAVDCR